MVGASKKKRLTSRVSTLEIKLDKVLHHPEEKNPCLRMFCVRYNVIDGKTMDDSHYSIVEIRERIKVATKRNRVFHGENGVRRVGFHYTA